MEDALRTAITGLIRCKSYDLEWHGAFGSMVVRVTDTKTFFNPHHVIDIGVPPGIPFPLETLSYLATAIEIERAGGAARFVESLIAAAEATAAWREYAARSVKASATGRSQQRTPSRPRPGRRRLKLDAPKG